MRLLQLKQLNAKEILLRWDDEHEGSVPVAVLRDFCPCAECKGETVLFQTYVPPSPNRETPGRYHLKGVASIGNYAMKFSWGDGHDLGLYTWELLRSLCGCSECISRREITRAM